MFLYSLLSEVPGVTADILKNAFLIYKGGKHRLEIKLLLNFTFFLVMFVLMMRTQKN